MGRREGVANPDGIYPFKSGSTHYVSKSLHIYQVLILYAYSTTYFVSYFRVLVLLIETFPPQKIILPYLLTFV